MLRESLSKVAEHLKSCSALLEAAAADLAPPVGSVKVEHTLQHVGTRGEIGDLAARLQTLSFEQFRRAWATLVIDALSNDEDLLGKGVLSAMGEVLGVVRERYARGESGGASPQESAPRIGDGSAVRGHAAPTPPAQKATSALTLPHTQKAQRIPLPILAVAPALKTGPAPHAPPTLPPPTSGGDGGKDWVGAAKRHAEAHGWPVRMIDIRTGGCSGMAPEVRSRLERRFREAGLVMRFATWQERQRWAPAAGSRVLGRPPLVIAPAPTPAQSGGAA